MQRFVTWFSANKRDLQTALAALAMVLILVYTFWHTAALLASYVTPAPVGWIAALGIEAAVVALSLRAGAYKKTLAAALIVSAIANIERGARESGLATGGLTLASVGGIDWLQAVIGIAATALLSVLVFRLADIVSHDAQGQSKKAATTETPVDPMQTPETDEPAFELLPQSQAVVNASTSLVAAPSIMLECPNGCGWKGRTPQSLAAHRRFCDARHTQKAA